MVQGVEEGAGRRFIYRRVYVPSGLYTMNIVELEPKYFLDERWQIIEPIPAPARLFVDSEDEQWRNWIRAIRIEIKPVTNTKKISSDDENDYLECELGMNIILPRGAIEEMRFKVTLKGGSGISEGVYAIDGFPKDIIEEKYIVSGKIKIGITKLFKFLPIVGNAVSDLLDIELNPWEFKIGNLKRVNVDFSGALTYEPEWYFKKDGIKNDLSLALTIKKRRSVKNIEADVLAAWIYDPGIFKKAIVRTNSKTINVYDA